MAFPATSRVDGRFVFEFVDGPSLGEVASHLALPEIVTVDGYLGIVTVGPPEFAVETAQARPGMDVQLTPPGEPVSRND